MLVRCGDEQAAADAILRLIDEPELARRIADTAFDGCTRYQWSAVRRQWLDLYRGMAEPRLAAAATTA